MLRWFRIVLWVGIIVSAIACKQRSMAKLQQAAGPQGAAELTLGPGHLAMLFPVDFAIEIGKQLVPLSAIFSNKSYQDLRSSLAGFKGDDPRNPQLANAGRNLPLNQWFVTGLRFKPCAMPNWPVPKQVFEKVGLVCRPVIQVSGQRFAQVKNVLVADDKSIHLIYAYHGGNTGAYSVLRQIETQLAAQFVDAPIKSASTSVQTIATKFNSNELKALRQSLLAKFVSDVQELANRTTMNDPELRIKSLTPIGVSTYQKYLANQLLKTATLIQIRTNFADTGTTGSSTRWLQSSILVTGSGAQQKLALEPIFFASGFGKDFDKYAVVSPGQLDVFESVLGSKKAIDKELQNQFISIPIDIGAPLLDRIGMPIFASYSPRSRRKLRSSGDVGSVDVVQKSYDLIHSQDVTAVSSSCTGCHIGPTLRLVGSDFPTPFRPTPGVEQVGVDNYAIGRLGVDVADFVPDQALLSRAWVLRQLGYFGQIPCIGDRLIFEVNTDIEWIKNFRKSQAH